MILEWTLTHTSIMSKENRQPRQTEQAKFLRRSPRLTGCIGSTPRRLAIHGDDAELKREQENIPNHGKLPQILIDISGSCNNILVVYHIPISIPLHTGHTRTAFEEIVIPTNISFEDFYFRVCAKMGLESETVSLGYKFNKDLRRDPYRHLANEHQLRVALARGADLIDRARKRRVVLEIQNMVSTSLLAMSICMLKYVMSLTGVSLPDYCFCRPEEIRAFSSIGFNN